MPNWFSSNSIDFKKSARKSLKQFRIRELNPKQFRDRRQETVNHTVPKSILHLVLDP